MSATLGIDAARSVDPARYAIAGMAPRHAVRPASREEVAEVLRAAAADGLTVLPWGGGVALEHELAPPAHDIALDLAGLDRVIEYDPADFTFTAECGVTIGTLRATLAARAQELPLEAAHADRATLGGVLAANASGPRRLRFGAPRDRILGARFVLGDGTPVRTGGKVVKNVAGFGIHRMLCGSQGALAVLIEASLKLAPAPEVRMVLIYAADAVTIADTARWSFLPRLEPAFVTVLGESAARGISGAAPGGGFSVAIGLEDDAPQVARQRERVETALGTPARSLEGSEAAAFAQSLADLEERDGARLSFTTAVNTPAALAPLLAAAEARDFVFHAPAGRLHMVVATERAQALADAAAAGGFLLNAARGAGELAPPAPPQAAILSLRARIRTALDPGSRFALGERWERGAV